MLSANLFVKVFEPGGSFSIDNITIPYSPYTSYVGIKMPEGEKPWGFLLTGKTHTAQIVDVDNQGNLLPGNKMWRFSFIKFNGAGGGITAAITSAILHRINTIN